MAGPAAGAAPMATQPSSELPGGLDGRPAPPQARPPQQGGGGGGRSLSSLVWFFGVYFFFQWLLGRGS